MNSKLVVMDKKNFNGTNGTTTSVMVSEVFNKRHDHVLRDIDDLKEKVTPQFWGMNFKEENRKIRGREFKQYILTKDGFIILVMGYTGKEAIQFKEAYIKRFNEMESFIRSREMVKTEFPALTDSIKEAHEEPKSYHYSNEIDMINRIVLGKTSKQYKEENNITGELRDNLTEEQLFFIKRLQAVDTGFIYAIPDYQERKKKLKEYYNKMVDERKLLEQK